MWFLQMAQVSTTMSQDQRDMTFSFLTSKRFLPGGVICVAPDFVDF